MKFCQAHWDRLREAIAAEGLSDLVAPDGETAIAQIVNALESEETTVANFDPLMAAHWAIIGRIGDVDPRVVLIEGCPLCWVQDEHDAHCETAGCEVTRQTFEDWIPDVARFQRSQWEKLQVESR